MATKRTNTKRKIVKKAPAKKAAAVRKPKAAPANLGPRHPRGRLTAAHGSKEALAKVLAATLVRGSEDKDELAGKLKTASNAQLLRLQKITETVKKKYGGREGLIEAIGKSENKGKDKDFISKLESLPLPHLLDLAVSAERRA